MKIKLLTYWKDKQLECCCPPHNKCARKGLFCEELEFTLNEFEGIEECMGHSSYEKRKGNIRQRR